LIDGFAILQKRLPDLTVVDQVGNEDQVFFSAWVELETEDGNKVEYRIVGGDEIDADTSKGYISVDSPMARALLKREVDEEVTIKIGETTTIYFINAIRYK